MNIPQNLIPRIGYINRIKPFVRKNLAKVLTGQRRVGKSYLLFQLIQFIVDEEPEANVVYINIEDFAFSKIRTATDLYEYITERLLDGEMNYIFIDEIQEIPEFERVIRSLLLSPLNDVYITGSNANMLSGELATYLSGRHVEFTVYSLSYTEFLTFHQLTDSDDSLARYTRFGGLPYLTHLPLEENVVTEYLKSVYSTIVFRDVVSRYKLRNTDFLERLIRFLSENIGSMFSAKNISDYLKSQQTPISVNQIQNYLHYLSNAFLVHRVERYDIVGKRLFEIGEKYYFENTGLRNIIIGYKVSDRAKLLENLVFNHLLYCGYEVTVGSLGGKEIDFIANRNHEKLYIQVALRIDSRETAEREYGNLMKISDNYSKMVVTADPVSGNSYEGILHYTIREFLTSISPAV